MCGVGSESGRGRGGKVREKGAGVGVVVRGVVVRRFGDFKNKIPETPEAMAYRQIIGKKTPEAMAYRQTIRRLEKTTRQVWQY